MIHVILWANFFFLPSQSQALFLNSFALPPSDAIFKMQDGERARVEGHIRKIFKENPNDPTDILRVNTLVPGKPFYCLDLKVAFSKSVLLVLKF